MDIDELDLNSLRIEFRNLERAHQETHKKLATLEARAIELVDETDELRATLGKVTDERDAAWTACRDRAVAQQEGRVMTRDHLTVHQLPGSRTVTLYCGRCTGALHLALPIRLDEIVEAARQFTERHKQCKKA